MRYLLVSLLAVLLASCSYKVRTIYDTKYDFKQLVSYCWLERCELTFQGPGYVDDSILVETVSQLISEELGRKGFKRDEEGYNFQVDVHIILEEKELVYQVTDDHGFEEGEWITSNQRGVSPEDEVFNYINGTFIVDVIDYESGSLIWRTAVIGAFDQKPEIETQELNKLVKACFRNFPPSE